MENIINEEDRDKFLYAIGLTVGNIVVSQVVDALEGKSHNSLYDLYTDGPRRDGNERKPVCSKNTVIKIKRLHQNGRLDPYLKYRESLHRKNKEKVNNMYLEESKSESSERCTGKYSEEWNHYERIIEAIIALKCARVEERGNWLDQIEKERVTLDDKEIQERLSTFIMTVEEYTENNLNVHSSVVDRIISDTSLRMNKRYKRSK